MGLFKKKQKSEKETEPEIKKVDVPQKTPPAPELFMLEPYVGCWFSSDVYKSSDLLPDGGEGKSRFDFRLTLNGYCYLADFLGSTPFGEYLWHSIWFYDPLSKMFKIQMYDNFANHSEGEGNFEKDGIFQITLKRKDGEKELISRHSLVLKDAENMEYQVENMVEEKYSLISIHSYHKVR